MSRVFHAAARLLVGSASPHGMRGGNWFPSTAILARRTAHYSLEGGAEGAFGFVAERLGNGGNGIA